MSFNLDHIIILFHAFSDCSSGLLCPFIYLCFCPRKILIQSRQFCFDSYLYVKWERGLCRVIAPVLCYMLKQLFLYFCPRTVQTFCQWISWTSSQKWRRKQVQVADWTQYEMILSLLPVFCFLSMHLYKDILSIPRLLVLYLWCNTMNWGPTLCSMQLLFL